MEQGCAGTDHSEQVPERSEPNVFRLQRTNHETFDSGRMVQINFAANSF